MPSEWASPRIPSPRVGDEIVVAGEFLHTDAPNRVVCWFDPGGFDAYRTTPALPVDTAPGSTPKQVAELGGSRALDAFAVEASRETDPKELARRRAAGARAGHAQMSPAKSDARNAASASSARPRRRPRRSPVATKRAGEEAALSVPPPPQGQR